MAAGTPARAAGIITVHGSGKRRTITGGITLRRGGALRRLDGIVHAEPPRAPPRGGDERRAC